MFYWIMKRTTKYLFHENAQKQKIDTQNVTDQ